MSVTLATLLAAAALAAPAGAHARACSGLPHDFDGDGRTDLAVAAPYQTVSGHARAGEVTILYGSGRTQKLSQDTPGTPDLAETGDSFGSALASGDFDGDGCADLAVGVSEEFLGDPVPGADGNGVVQLFHGSADGLRPGRRLAAPRPGSDRYGAALAAGDLDGDRADELAVGAPTHGGGGAVFLVGVRGLSRVAQSTGWVRQRGLATDQWGAALAIGDADGDGRAELAVGAPADSVELDGQGSVTLIDPLARKAALVTQDSPGLKGKAEKWDSFGAALTAGDFDADGRADLAVGSPGEGLTPGQRALDYGDGMVHVLYGTRHGWSTRRSEAWTQNVLDGRPRYYDRFGSSLAAGDFNGDGDDELAVGVPGERAVQVLAGTRSGGLTRHGDLLVKGRGGDFGTALAAVRAPGSRYRTLAASPAAPATASVAVSATASRPVWSLAVAAPGKGVVTLVPGTRRPGPYPGLRPAGAREWTTGSGLYGYALD
ncbi:FG-GAP and VCBS repeat-containing protein [Thermoactinospora rubra]|uniref:FG-GAP and VCBS repeat-containing protein n=1 Tax=Thermoactinospora rubra TaxID=1088767 RepID=UPI000A0F89DE|nr:FG-GAP and VCBS repeat-containing protein [Thermoactinospora rubra]